MGSQSDNLERLRYAGTASSLMRSHAGGRHKDASSLLVWRSKSMAGVAHPTNLYVSSAYMGN